MACGRVIRCQLSFPDPKFMRIRNVVPAVLLVCAGQTSVWKLIGVKLVRILSVDVCPKHGDGG